MKGGSRSEKLVRRSNHKRGVFLKINYKLFIVLFCLRNFVRQKIPKKEVVHALLICFQCHIYILGSYSISIFCMDVRRGGGVIVLDATGQGEGVWKLPISADVLCEWSLYTLILYVINVYKILYLYIALAFWLFS